MAWPSISTETVRGPLPCGVNVACLDTRKQAEFVKAKDQCALVNRQRFRLLWLLVLLTAIFITLWFCGRGIWAILFWSFVFGDDGPYEEYGRWIAAIVALLISATVLVRMAWGFASRRFLRICLGGTVSLAAVFGLVCYTHAPIRPEEGRARIELRMSGLGQASLTLT
jgi:hypothetical protein